jgi:hypothetical protein
LHKLEGGNTIFNVYSVALLQICRDYNVLPDLEKITIKEIRFFYNGLKQELKQRAKDG